MSERHENFPNAFEATLLVVLLFIVEVIIASAFHELDWFSDVQWNDLSGLVVVIGNGVFFCALMAYKRLRYADLFHPSPLSVNATLGVLTLPILLLTPGLVITTGLLNSIVIAVAPMTPEEQAFFADMVSNQALALLFGCVVAPLLEEMLFRGVILRSFLHQYSRTGAILGSAALFAFAHMNVYQLFTALGLGIVAGWLYERTRSLWPGILLHAAFNSFVAYWHAWAAESQMSFSAAFYGVAFVMAIVSGLVLLRVLMPGKRLTTER